jgi:hypothetical protein
MTEKDLEGSGRGIIEILPQQVSGGTDKNHVYRYYIHVYIEESRCAG